MNIKRSITSAVLAAALAAATGCTSRTGPAGEVPEAPASEAAENRPEGLTAIVVEDFAYEQLPDSVTPGATVTVINDGEATHTVTAQGEGVFDVVVPGGRTTTFAAPEEPGAYPIACTYHPEMSGILVVE